jgi:predicted porin
VGGEYNLSKRTKLYADYAHVSGDLPAAQDNEKNAYDFGLSHAF